MKHEENLAKKIVQLNASLLEAFLNDTKNELVKKAMNDLNDLNIYMGLNDPKVCKDLIGDFKPN